MNAPLFYCNSILGGHLIQDFDLCKLQDLWPHNMDTELCKFTKYGISVAILSLQGWCVARTTHCDSGYNITIARYSLPDFYLPKMKKCYSRVIDFLVLVLCNVNICSHPLNKHKSKWHFLKEGNSEFTLCMERAYSPLCCHGNLTVDMSWNFVMSITTVHSFSFKQKKAQEI